MEKFSIKNLKRNGSIVKTKIKKIGTSLVAKDDIRIMVPARFKNKELVTFNMDIKVYMFAAIIDSDNNYSVTRIPAMLTLTPELTEEVLVGNEEYLLFRFAKNTIISPDTKVAKMQSLLFNIFEEFFMRGKIPWYMEYNDVSKLFLQTSKYSGSGAGNNPAAVELLTSIIARSPKDTTELFRYMKEASKDNITYIALLNVYYTFNSTMAKLGGSYFDQGITSALNNPEQEPSITGAILTS